MPYVQAFFYLRGPGDFCHKCKLIPSTTSPNNISSNSQTPSEPTPAVETQGKTLPPSSLLPPYPGPPTQPVAPVFSIPNGSPPKGSSR